MAGRPPKSIEQHKLDGTFQKCRHSDRGTNLNPIKHIECPESIGGKAREIWNTMIPPLCASNLITVADIPILEDAFIKYQFAEEIRKAIRYEGGVVKYLQGLSVGEKNLLGEYRYLTKEFEATMYKFGVTPTEAAKVRGAGKKDDGDDDSVITDLIGNG